VAAFAGGGRSTIRSQLTKKGRKPPSGDYGWISSSEGRETATSGPSPTSGERLLNTESGHPKAVAGRRQVG